jgi:D-alanine-D-alanine ligase
MTTVAVLYNDDAQLLRHGDSQDRVACEAVALEARNVASALRRRGFDAVEIAAGSDVADLWARLAGLGAVLVFNLCESFAGNSRMEAAVASFLELLGIPYTGNNSLTLAMAQDKAVAKQLMAARGLAVARWAVLQRPDDPLPPDLTPPVFVKTRFEDASHGISERSVCRTIAAAREQAAELMRVWQQDCLVEEFLPGREFNAGVLFDAELLPLAEIDYELPSTLPNIVTYEAKWNAGSVYDLGTPVRCPAENVDDQLGTKIRDAVRAVYRAFGCRDYARVDMRVDAAGTPYILEVNPNPDLADGCAFAQSVRASGRTYQQAISQIVAYALGRARHGNGSVGPTDTLLREYLAQRRARRSTGG